QWAELLLKSCVRSLLSTCSYPICIFSHRIKDPEEKADDGTFDGIMDRSYTTLKSMIRYLKSYEVQFTNSLELITSNPIDLDVRHNIIRNTNFETTKFGYTGEIWGLSSFLSVAEAEASSSIDGCNVALMDATITISKRIY